MDKNNVKKIKGSVFSRQKNTIIALAVIFAVLLCAYLFIIRPLLKDDNNISTEPVELIWENEILGPNNRVQMFETVDSEVLSEVKVHNPSLLAKYGEQYVDWSIYRAPKGTTIAGYEVIKDTFYLKDYEYAPLNEDEQNQISVLADIINDAGYTLTLSRVVDHAEDFSKYGLDYENDEDAIYCEVIKLDGTSYKFYVGDKIPSGTAYYVRMAGKDVCKDKNSEFYGQEIENDSVYIYDCTNVLISPTETIAPILTYPMDTNTQSYFDMFAILNSHGINEEDTETLIHFLAITDSYKKKPVSAFAPMAVYYTTIPTGYYSSDAFEALFEQFMNGIRGSKVCELATLMSSVNEETGKEEDFYGFSDEILEKYFTSDEMYCITFSWDGVPNIVYVSKETENGTYYAYSLVFNTICEVSADTLAFLKWDRNMFIQKEIFQMNIINCAEIMISGKYFDYALESGEIPGETTVEGLFKLEHNNDDSLKLTSPNASYEGKMTYKEWDANFRILYQLLLALPIREEIDSELIKDIMNGESYAEIKVTSAEQVVYKVDSEGNETAVVDYTVESMTRIYRFYKYTSGRSLVTIESIDADGKSEGENGSFYILTSTVENLLRATDMHLNGEVISKYERG